MNAIMFRTYGSPDVFTFEQVEKPIPKEKEVLVKIEAVSVNAADWHYMRAKPIPIRFVSGLLKPKINILGADIAGTVEAVGKDVRQFKSGDAVFGDLSNAGFGGFAEYVCTREDVLALQPAGSTFAEAAAIPLAAATALQGLRKGQIHAGQKVLINGASGGVGTFAVQIAKAFGAEVTGVCSTGKMDMVRSIGADHVIDRTKEDFTTNGQQYDLILAANGYHPIKAYKRALSPGGAYIMTGGSNAQLFQVLVLGPWMSKKNGKKLVNVLAKPNQQDLYTLKELFETGKIKPVIDRRYTLREVPEAIRYLEEGHAKGKVIITQDR